MLLDISFDSNKFNLRRCNCARVTVTQDNGERQTKTVAINKVMEAMTKSMVRENEYSRIGRVPNGFYDGSIMEAEGKGLSAKVVIVLPKAKQHMVFEATRYHTCTPSLAFYFETIEDRLMETRVYALKDKKPSNKSELYVYPFGNVNTEDGRVCWGSNQAPGVKRIKQLEGVTSLFIQSPCNMDYYNAEKSTKLGVKSLRELFERLKGLEEFPDEILQPRGGKPGYRNLGDITDDFVNNRQRYY